MNLSILSPTTRQDISVQWVEVQTTDGGYVILPGHAPLIAQLAPQSQLKFSPNGTSTESVLIPNGLLKVTQQQVIIIIDE